MTDHLADAIVGPTSWHPRTATVAATDAADHASQLLVAGRPVACIDEMWDWRHVVNDPVAIDWDQVGVPHVIRSLAHRPSTGTVTTVGTDTWGTHGAVTGSDGLSWTVRIIGSPAVGDSVQIMWNGTGGVAWRGARPAQMLPDGVTVATPPDRAPGLPGVIADSPDPATDVVVRAVQSASLTGGVWRLAGQADTVTQGSPTGADPASGAWLYAGGLDFLAGRTITSAAIDVTRTDAGGIPAVLVFQLHTAATLADTPSWVGSQWTGPQILPGEHLTVDLPPQHLGALITGAACGIGVVGDQWADLAGVGVTVTSGALHLVTRTG